MRQRLQGSPSRTTSRTTRRPALVAATLLLPLVLGACGGDVARSFGLTRDPPDEFQVTTRAPLSMPPDFALRPPRAGRPQGPDPSAQARGLIAAAPVPSTAASPGEAALLREASAASAAPVTPDIREVLDRETQALARSDASFTNRVLGFGSPPAPVGVPVDAEAEARRIRENAALGRDVSEGDTPVVQPDRSFWGRLFGS